MNIQTKFNNEAINQLINVKEIIQNADKFERNQMIDYTLRTILNLSSPLNEMTLSDKETLELEIIEVFKFHNWV